ncbi:uncharacterized protein LOC143034977 [Oratosquilla oratoria]|uniref:uncharacterized protein LOC143034977 n=1 Tax=Oratosquilla oratoria TaxID=337810 RepID=UPI003F76D79A
METILVVVAFASLATGGLSHSFLTHTTSRGGAAPPPLQLHPQQYYQHPDCTIQGRHVACRGDGHPQEPSENEKLVSFMKETLSQPTTDLGLPIFEFENYSELSIKKLAGFNNEQLPTLYIRSCSAVELANNAIDVYINNSTLNLLSNSNGRVTVSIIGSTIDNLYIQDLKKSVMRHTAIQNVDTLALAPGAILTMTESSLTLLPSSSVFLDNVTVTLDRVTLLGQGEHKGVSPFLSNFTFQGLIERFRLLPPRLVPRRAVAPMRMRRSVEKEGHSPDIVVLKESSGASTAWLVIFLLLFLACAALLVVTYFFPHKLPHILHDKLSIAFMPQISEIRDVVRIDPIPINSQSPGSSSSERTGRRRGDSDVVDKQFQWQQFKGLEPFILCSLEIADLCTKHDSTIWKTLLKMEGDREKDLESLLGESEGSVDQTVKFIEEQKHDKFEKKAKKLRDIQDLQTPIRSLIGKYTQRILEVWDDYRGERRAISEGFHVRVLEILVLLKHPSVVHKTVKDLSELVENYVETLQNTDSSFCDQINELYEEYLTDKHEVREDIVSLIRNKIAIYESSLDSKKYILKSKQEKQHKTEEYKKELIHLNEKVLSFVNYHHTSTKEMWMEYLSNREKSLDEVRQFDQLTERHKDAFKQRHSQAGKASSKSAPKTPPPPYSTIDPQRKPSEGDVVSEKSPMVSGDRE